MKKKAILILIPITVFAFILVTISLYNNRLEKIKTSCHDEYSMTTTMLDKLLSERQCLLENESKLTFNNEFFSLKNKKTNVGNLNLENSCLCVYISRDFCKDCVDYCLEYLKEYILDGNNALVFAAGYLPRDLYVFAKEQNLNTDLFFTVDKLDFPISKLLMPFFFVLDPNHEVKYFFVPRKEIDDQTMRYFELLKMNI